MYLCMYVYIEIWWFCILNLLTRQTLVYITYIAYTYQTSLPPGMDPVMS